MQIDRFDYAMFGARENEGGGGGGGRERGTILPKYEEDFIAEDLFTTLVRSRKRNFFDSSMSRRDWTPESARGGHSMFNT